MALRNLEDMSTFIEAQMHYGIDHRGNATLLWHTTGSIVLHELHHFVDIVTPRYFGTRDHAYMPQDVYNLAQEYGCGEDVDGEDAGYMSSLNNADSFNVFSNAVYWSKKYGLPANDFPPV